MACPLACPHACLQGEEGGRYRPQYLLATLAFWWRAAAGGDPTTWVSRGGWPGLAGWLLGMALATAAPSWQLCSTPWN